jgi:hypothetical protein
MRANQGRSHEENSCANSLQLKISALVPHRAVQVLYVNPTASAGLVGWPRESTPPVALGSFLKSSKHCVKLAAATREERHRKRKRIRVGIGCMSPRGRDRGDSEI